MNYDFRFDFKIKQGDEIFSRRVDSQRLQLILINAQFSDSNNNFAGHSNTNPQCEGENGYCGTEPMPRSCNDLKSRNYVSGNYILIDSNNLAFATYCDMDSDGGGWSLVASVATQSSFWSASTYTEETSALKKTLGSPSLSENYVLKLPTWKTLLSYSGDESELRLTVKQMEEDGGETRTLGTLVGIQMKDNFGFTNPKSSYNGTGFKSTSLSRCVIQFSSNFESSLSRVQFYTSACTSGILW